MPSLATGRCIGDRAILSVATYNCEGLLSALPYVEELLHSRDIVFLAETWLSRAEEYLLPSFLQDLPRSDYFVIQEYAMDLPPGASEGRRHGGVAMICRNRPDLHFTQVPCDDVRLCAVNVCDSLGPRLTVLAVTCHFGTLGVLI